MSNVTRTFDYRPRWTTIALAGALFGANSLILGAKANSNDHGLIINGIIVLSKSGATTFYWVIAALSAVFVVVAMFLVFVRLTISQRISLTPTSIVLPKSRWSAKLVDVPHTDILNLSATEVYGQRFLKIEYRGGKFTIAASLLPRNADFETICSEIATGLASVHDNAC